MSGAPAPGGKSGLSHDLRVFVLTLGSGLPAVLLSLYFVWTQLPARAAIPLAVVVVGVWLGIARAVRRTVVRPLATLANLLAGVREGDFSFRARGAREEDPLGLTFREINALADTLREQRLGAMEATALLRKVMLEIDVVVLAFDARQRLVLSNHAGERLFERPSERLLGRTAARLGVESCFDGDPQRTEELALGGSTRRWELRRSSFRQGGRPMTLLVLSDLSRILHQEEREAWRRLIRVVSHEINNSLAPISSIAGTLERLVSQSPLPDDWREDTTAGLDVVKSRAEGLQRFMAAYAQLTRLPAPSLAPVDVGELVRHVAAMETRVPVKVVEGPKTRLEADRAQLEQLLINVLRNASEAALEAAEGATPEVTISWKRGPERLVLRVRDNGLGVGQTKNLFVPFYSTKKEGSGVGLVLSRQIAQAHGGTVSLRDRDDADGAEFTLELPLARGAAKPSSGSFIPVQKRSDSTNAAN